MLRYLICIKIEIMEPIISSYTLGCILVIVSALLFSRTALQLSDINIDNSFNLFALFNMITQQITLVLFFLTVKN